jgi:uncharacterized protein
MPEESKRIVVSLRAGVFFAIANVLCVIIATQAWLSTRNGPQTIQVTGSARKPITSDLAVWSATITVTDPDIQAAYKRLAADVARTRTWLGANKIKPEEIELRAISITKHYERTAQGAVTDKVNGYELEQAVQVSSADVHLVEQISRGVTALIADGVQVESSRPSYMYTRISDVKVQMLADATKDARNRAEQISTNSGGTLGKVVEARMGILQINARNDTQVSGSGMNDTSSIEKDITAVITARFEVR